MKNKLILFFLLVNMVSPWNVFALSITFTDNYTSSGSTTGDGVVWGGYSIYSKANNIDANADCLCWDWCDNGAPDSTNTNWDACDCKTQAAMDSCRATSSLVDTICAAGNCVTTNLTNNHNIDTGSDGQSWVCRHDVREYRNCAGGTSIIDYEGQYGKPYYVINATQYDCENSPLYDTEGKYGNSWLKIVSKQSCSINKQCDEKKDDTQVFTSTGIINDPCRTIDWASCSTNNQCISNFCYENVECSPCNNAMQCTSTAWNACYNNGKTCCSQDAVNNQYFCDYNEQWAECTTTNHVDGQQKDSYVCSNAGGAWHWTKEDDTSQTQCDYYLSKSNGLSCDCATECAGNYCWGTYTASYACKSSCTSEGNFTPSDQCCAGLQWNPITKACFNPKQPNIAVNPLVLIYEI